MRAHSRRAIAQTVALGAAVVCALNVFPREDLFAAGAAGKPNVIVILVDDLGYADAGFNGCRDIPTPNIDRLAQQGIRCTHGYVTNPLCSPSRAGLMTGRYQERFGHENNPRFDPADEKLGLPLDQTTLAQAMQQAGYVTGMVGKWHLGAAPCFHPTRRGFDEFYGFVGGRHDYFQAQSAGRPPEHLIPIERNRTPETFQGYLTDVLSSEAAAFVRRHKAERFFLYLPYNAPHGPFQASDKYLARFAHLKDPQRRTYAAMVSAVDDGLGVLLATLRELNLDDDTLIFFLSDNGGPVGKSGASNGALQKGKGNLLEGGIRVPFVVRWPQGLSGGVDYREPVSSLDIFPTSVAAAGGTLPANLKLDGVDLLPYLRGQKHAVPHEALFWRIRGGVSYAVRSGNLKLAKLGTHAPALFDLESDPGETHSLADSQPQKVEELSKKYDQWNRQMIAPLWEPLNETP